MSFPEVITVVLLVFAMLFVFLYFGKWARPPGPEYSQQFKDTLGVFAGFLGLALGFFFQQGKIEEARDVATDAVVQLRSVNELLDRAQVQEGPAGDSVIHVPAPIADSIRRVISSPVQPSWIKNRLPREIQQLRPGR